MSPTNPLAEVFGFPIDDFSDEAHRHRNDALCPYNNRVPECTKDRKADPLGACDVYHEGQAIITCPIRFREDWKIARDAAAFFFRDGTEYDILTELRLRNRKGKSAGNIDVILAAFDDAGNVVDFGAMEVQSVYISGNMRNPFSHYMEDPAGRAHFDWQSIAENYPRPDYLSSEKRLLQQLQSKGTILNAWKKKQAVAVQTPFFESLPSFSEVSRADADIVWLLYEMKRDDSGRFHLTLDREAFMDFETMLDEAAVSQAGDINEFTASLKKKRNKGQSKATLSV